MHDAPSIWVAPRCPASAARRLRIAAGSLTLLLAWTCSAGAEDAVPPAFVPGEISIGEPIVLPATSAPPANAAPVAAASAAALPGNGWLGIVIDESPQPGRWMVAEVLPESPAARAGIRAGDEVRAINGTVLRNADDAAQALTAIAAGQTVDVAIARAEGVQDVRLMAMPRPSPPSRDGRAAAGPELSRSPAMAPPTRTVPQPESIPVPAWAAPGAGSVPAPAVPPGPATAPAFLPPPAAGAAPATRIAPAAGQWAAAPAAAALPAPRGRTALGVRTVPIDQQTQARFQLPAAQGAYVIGVVQDLPAARAGVPPGSVIVALDQRPVHSPDHLTDLVTSGPVGRPVSLEYRLPGGAAHKAEVVLQSLDAPLERALVDDQPATGGRSAPPVGAAADFAPAASPRSYRSERPVDGAAVAAARDEIRRLRARLDDLERLLQGAAPARP
jgi:membrane-associated protease RseP (regulator of RpoE activity)